MKTYKGTLLEPNLFEDENGIKSKVFLTNYLYTVYKDSIPMQCFILLDGDTIRNIFILD